MSEELQPIAQDFLLAQAVIERKNPSDPRGHYVNIAQAIAKSRTNAIVNSHKALREALEDAMSGIRYLRETHGEFYGFGFDRIEENGRRRFKTSQQP